MNPNLQMLLNRLEYVTEHNGQYRARCPVHGGKNRSSLRIKISDRGVIWLRCFSNDCPALEIVNVCGLEMTDLFPERLSHHYSPQEKLKWREAATVREIEAVRKLILHETRIAWIAGKQIKDGKPLNDIDDARLDQVLKVLETEGRRLNGNA